jgi:hypothetical protein
MGLLAAAMRAPGFRRAVSIAISLCGINVAIGNRLFQELE